MPQLEVDLEQYLIDYWYSYGDLKGKIHPGKQILLIARWFEQLLYEIGQCLPETKGLAVEGKVDLFSAGLHFKNR